MCKFETFLSEEKENDTYMYEKNCNAQTQNKFQLSYFIQNINLNCIRKHWYFIFHISLLGTIRFLRGLESLSSNRLKSAFGKWKNISDNFSAQESLCAMLEIQVRIYIL